ncbi:MAG: hypothetical protein WBJ62_05555 [Coriobacteriia bacterium]
MNSRERFTLRRFAEYVVRPVQRPTLISTHRQALETGYRPIYDPYRFLIRAIVHMHEQGLPPESLEAAVERERSSRQRNVIGEAMTDYVGWVAAADITGCFPVAATDWRCEEACVRVNPEVGLEIGGERLIVKLHLAKGSPISPDEAAVMTTVMREGLGDAVPGDCGMAVLDVRTGVLHRETPADDSLRLAIQTAAVDLAARWEQAS